ncbi:lipoprotein [Mycoplasma yeatsii]|uniref:TolA-binding protein n=1 Tax=Mycoplasma yeatsii TaxID=51365 RepID=A0ABU0NDN6_9MOLU|nr:lipoprotein [Mycoplasma yeatsii]MDQ0567553.1 TolA-binding protein [Mycoplasma yeatsii]
MKLSKRLRTSIITALIASCIASTSASIYFSKVFTVNTNLVENHQTINQPIINKSHINKLLTDQNQLNINNFKVTFLNELKKQNKDLKVLDDLVSFTYNKTEVCVNYKNYKWFYKIVYN